MSNVAGEGRTVLFVSHNMAAIEALCSTAFLLRGGRLEFNGETDVAINQYLESVRNISSYNLIDRTDRSGNGQMRITNIMLLDNNEVLLEELPSGKDAYVVIGYQAERDLTNVSISLGFYGALGQFLLLCNNEMVGQQFTKLPSRGEIKCIIPNFPFASGSYLLNIHCEVNGILADWVQEAYHIEVTEGDFYGTGKSPMRTHGGFLAHHHWEYYGI